MPASPMGRCGKFTFPVLEKGIFEGANCTPFIVHWPDGLKGLENTLNHGVDHVMDISPTCLELAGAEYPTTVNGFQTTPQEGKSLLSVLYQKISTQHDTLFWKHEGGKAARVGDWKIAALKNEPWELFNLVEDRAETNNLAFKHPDKVEAFAVL